MLNRKWTVAAVLGVILSLSGCSIQSVTYDPDASRGKESSASVAVTSAPVTDLTESKAGEAVTLTPEAEIPVTEAPVTATVTPAVSPTASPTPTPTPTIAPITPIEITPKPDPDKGMKLIGEKAEGDSVFRAQLTNKTGLTIAWFSVKDNFTDYFPKNMLGKDETVPDKQKRVLYYDADHGMKESAEREEKDQYEIRLALKTDAQLKDSDSEGRYYILHDVPFRDMEEAVICFNKEDTFPYLKYISKSTGKEVSTESAERAIYYDSEESPSGSGSGSEEGSSYSSNEGSSQSSGDGSGNSDRGDEEQTGYDRDDTDDGDADDGDDADGGEEEEIIHYEDTEDTIIYYDDSYEENENAGDGGEDVDDEDAVG